MKKMKKLIGLVAMFIFMLALTACGDGEAEGAEKGYVGISMPTQSSERWISDGNNMVEKLEDLGFRTSLQFAEDVVENQVSQIENMITQGVDMLVIAPIDGEALTSVLDQAASQGISVISYDRLLMNSEHVSYYVTFDNFRVGVLQGQFIVDQLGLEDGEGPFNIEVFAGSPDDSNSHFFFDGAMSILQPFIDNGQLVVRSGQTDFSQVATLRWDGATAQARMDNILSAHYTTERVDAVLSPYDGISIGVVSSLMGVGYGTDANPMPIITGQDAEIPSIKSIIRGEQTQTIFKDTRILAERAVEMINAILNDEEAPINDTESYDNGVKVIPTYKVDIVSVDITNWEEVLVDSGFFTLEQLGQ